MIKDFVKYRLPDKNGKNDLVFEINYSDKEEVKDAKIIRWSTGDKRGFIDRKTLYEFLWMIGTPEDHKRMIPQKITKVKWYETVLGITATKDIKKGERINVPIKLSLPATEEEIIGEKKKKSIFQI